jgi:hypothetical protein
VQESMDGKAWIEEEAKIQGKIRKKEHRLGK